MNSAFAVRYFQFAGYRLAYRVLGEGPAVILAFHGFGQDGRVFLPFEPVAAQQCTIYSFDLFFHGESQISAGQLLTKTTWQSLIGAFVQTHQIERFSLMGFSLGGRFALVTAEQYAPQLEQLVLIAPDGITQTIWYRLATSSQPGRWLFKIILRHLSALNRIGHVLTKLGLLHRMVMRFTAASLASSEQRQQVYLSWIFFREIQPNLSLLATLLNQSLVRVRFFTGYFDYIVPGSFIRPLTKRVYRYELTVLKAGHNRLIEQVANLF